MFVCAFVLQNIKKKFPLVLGRINQLIGRLESLGPQASIDVDQAALRVTLDVIGLVRDGGRGWWKAQPYHFPGSFSKNGGCHLCHTNSLSETAVILMTTA